MRAALAETAVIKLNGGLGTSMGMDRPKSAAAGQGRADASSTSSPARCSRCASARTTPALPLVLHEQLPHRGDTLAALARVRRPRGRRPAAGLPAEHGAQAARRRPDPGRVARRPRARVVPAGPRRPLHRAARRRAARRAARRGLPLRVRLQRRQPRRVARRADRRPGSRASGVPFAIEVCRRTAADRKGGHLARPQVGRPARAARDRADAGRRTGRLPGHRRGTGTSTPTTCGSTCDAAAPSAGPSATASSACR